METWESRRARHLSNHSQASPKIPSSGCIEPRRDARPKFDPSAVCRRDLSRGDLVFEVIGIEAVEAAFGRFRLRIHEEADWRPARPGQSDIVGEVVRHPIHFPRPK